MRRQHGESGNVGKGNKPTQKILRPFTRFAAPATQVRLHESFPRQSKEICLRYRRLCPTHENKEPYLVEERRLESARSFHVGQARHVDAEAAIWPISLAPVEVDHLAAAERGWRHNRDETSETTGSIQPASVHAMQCNYWVSYVFAMLP